MKNRKIEMVFENSVPKANLGLYLKFWKFVVNKQLLAFIGYTILLIAISLLTPLVTFIWNQYIDSVINCQKIKFSIILLLLYIVIKIAVDFGFFFSMCYMDRINFASWILLDGAINKKAMSIKSEYFEIPELQARINRAWDFSHGSYIELYQLGLEILRSITQIAGTLLSLALIDYHISLIAMFSIFPALYSTILVDKNRIEYDTYLSNEKLESGYYKNAKYNQDLIKDIICNDAFDFFHRKFVIKSNEIYVKSFIFEKKQLRYLLIEGLLRNVIVICCIIYTALQVIYGSITLGGLSVTFGLIVNLVYSMERLTKNIATVYTRTANIAQFYEFMDMDEDIHMIQNTESVQNDFFDIVLKNVCYTYPFSEREVLKDINLYIKKGCHVAIVGDNGSGKTTLIKLLMGLLEPSEGRVFTLKFNSNRDVVENSSFTAVFQDFCKYKESFKYNIAVSDFGKIDNDNNITEVLRKVRFDKNINFQSVLSKEFGGIELSGGEWQKVAAARAAFKEAAVIVLDEPTAAIDPLEETELYKLFDEMSAGKTCFFVTHRLGSVLLSDLVLFMEDGKIIEQGTHTQLLKANGKYAKYWNTQANQYGE